MDGVLTVYFFLFFFRPKIQRLVTPLRLQRRRHLRSVKNRRIDSQKAQKAEYESVMGSSAFLLLDIFLCGSDDG